MTMAIPDWSGATGDIWAERWRDTDRGLAEVGLALDAAIRGLAPAAGFRALDVGCGPGTTALALATARPDSAILGCDLSRALIEVAERRVAGLAAVRFIVADAEVAARDHGPFELIFSRHGVMFFPDPRRAFGALRAAAAPGAALVFSCFADWAENPWASQVASAAAGSALAAPGREAGGFAFADPAYVGDILGAAGWAAAEPVALDFTYVAGEGEDAAEQALAFLGSLGPAARVIEGMDATAREAALDRMRAVIADHLRDRRITFPAAAWIWSARAQ